MRLTFFIAGAMALAAMPFSAAAVTTAPTQNIFPGYDVVIYDDFNSADNRIVIPFFNPGALSRTVFLNALVLRNGRVRRRVSTRSTTVSRPAPGRTSRRSSESSSTVRRRSP